MSSGDVEVHPQDLRQVQDLLDKAGQALFTRADDLDQAPDAGVSTGEVGRALSALASGVAGLSQHLGELATNTGLTGADFSGTDASVSGAMRQRQGVLGP